MDQVVRDRAAEHPPADAPNQVRGRAPALAGHPACERGLDPAHTHVRESQVPKRFDDAGSSPLVADARYRSNRKALEPPRRPLRDRNRVRVGWLNTLHQLDDLALCGRPHLPVFGLPVRLPTDQHLRDIPAPARVREDGPRAPGAPLLLGLGQLLGHYSISSGAARERTQSAALIRDPLPLVRHPDLKLPSALCVEH